MEKTQSNLLREFPWFPHEFHYKLTADGKKIYDYVEVDVEEVMKNNPEHPRIIMDWPLRKFSYCPLDLRIFLKHPHKVYKFTDEEWTLLTKPVPKAKSNKELKNILEWWFHMFNAWLFAGTISSTATITVVDGMWPGNFKLYSQDENAIQIRFPSCKEVSKLSVLLHVMLHAWIYQYSCQKRCCQFLEHPCLGGFGRLGHGPAWADVMMDLKDIVKKVLNWEVEEIGLHLTDLYGSIRGLYGGVGESMCIDNWQPNTGQLERWGFDPSIWGHIDNWDSKRKEFIALYDKIYDANN